MNKNNYSYPTLNKFIVNEKLKLKDCLKIIEKMKMVWHLYATKTIKY